MNKRDLMPFIKDLFWGKKSTYWKYIFGTESFYNGLIISISLLLFLLMPLLSIDYGITGDEYVDHRHAGYVIDYYLKGDTKALDQPKTLLNYYGISAQVIVRAITDFFGIENYYEARHAMCSIFGVLAIVFTGLLGRRIGGGLSGVLSMIMLLFVPRFFGHSMNNLKDIPFAFGYVFSIYYIIKLFDSYPRFKPQNILLLIVGIAFTIGNRAGGLLLIPYLFMYGGLFYINITGGIKEFFRFKKHKKSLFLILSVVIIISLLGYFGSVVLWPYALENPIQGPIDSLKLLTRFKIGIRQIFEGEQVMSNLLPIYYAPKYLFITLPLTVLTGLLFYFIRVFTKPKNIKLVDFFIVYTAIFPVFWVVYKNSNLYGGIRHLLFVIPIFVVMSSSAWKELICRIKSKKVCWIIISLLAFLFALPMRWMIISHPNQYIYFNEIAGGINNAYGDYELDYYFNSEKLGADWIKENVVEDSIKKLVVASHGKSEHYFREYENVDWVYTRYYERSKKDWDYAVFVNEYIDRFQLNHNLFPPAGTVKVIELQNKPICIVVKRVSKEDYTGFEALNNQEYDEAIKHFKNHLKLDSKSEQVWFGLSQAYFFKKDYKNSLTCVDKALQYYPAYISALHIKSLVYLETKQNTKAITVLDDMLKRRKIIDVMHLKAVAYYHLKRYHESIQIINKILKLNPTHIKSLDLAGKILMENKDYMQAIKIFTKVSKKIKNDPYVLYYLAKCHTKLNDIRLAYIYMNKLSTIKKGYYPAIKLQAELFIKQNNKDKASIIINNLLEKVNNDSELYYLAGLLESKKGNNTLAKTYLNKCIGLKKDYKEAIVLLDKFSLNTK